MPKIKFISCGQTVPIEQIQNNSLYITATQSLRRLRAADERLADFLHGGKSRLVSWTNNKKELTARLKDSGGYISRADQLFILSNVISSCITEAEHRQMLEHSKRELFELYDALIRRGIGSIDADRLAMLEREYTKSTADIFRLYNSYIERLNNVQNADDELLSYDNKEGAFLLYFEAYGRMQKKQLAEYGSIILDGFLFFNDDQLELITAAAELDKQIIIINTYAEFLRRYLYVPLIKRLGATAEYITAEDPTPNSTNDIAEVSRKLFTAGNVPDLRGFKFIEPFINREDEFTYIVKEISRRLKNEGGCDLERIKEIINTTAIILRTTPEEQSLFDEILKDYGLFIKKADGGTAGAPDIAYSKAEFMQARITDADGKELTRRAKLDFFKENYKRLRINTRKRSFVEYPVGQFVCEIYRTLADGMSVEGYKKLLYSNWRYNVGETDERYDRHIKEFGVIEAYFIGKTDIDEWLAEFRRIKQNKRQTSGDSAYLSHPFTAVSDESLAFMETHTEYIKATVAKLSAINGTIKDHVQGLRSLFNEAAFKDADDAEDDSEKAAVKRLLELVNEIADTSMLTMNAAYFGRNVRAMLTEYESELTEDSDRELILKTDNLESRWRYKHIFVPIFEADKLPIPFAEPFPFTATVKAALKDKRLGLNFTFLKNVDLDYHLEFGRWLIKNTLSLGEESVTITQSENDGGKPMQPSVYIKDILGLAGKEIKYEPANQDAAPSQDKAPYGYGETLNLAVRDCELSDLLLYLVCPKMLFHASRHGGAFTDSFQLGLLAGGVVYYKFFERFCTECAGKVFNEAELREKTSVILKTTAQAELDNFNFLSVLEKNDIYSKVLNQVTEFYQGYIHSGRYRCRRFKLELTAPMRIEHGGIAVSIPRRLRVTDADKGTYNDFDITKRLKFLLLSGDGKKYDFKHYAEIIEQLEKGNPNDDRIAMVNFLFFKITVQLASDKFREDGVIRIKELIDGIKDRRFHTYTGLPSDYCKCCRVKNLCRGTQR